MKLACVRALAELTRKEVQQIGPVSQHDETLTFGPDYIIPKPFDPRLLVQLAPAVAQAAMDSGVATRPLDNMNAYRASLDAFVFRTSLLMNTGVRCREAKSETCCLCRRRRAGGVAGGAVRSG